ncbi:MAG TPA: rhomboid family intramembrane serine protease [Bacteroidales bacterium]|nr:rhomboid family intramembrane serine protease [Bacteroidales bacterium]HNS47879.1 rhomboid family intramembrane serine protease [Bacteroidales bacterium]
MPAPYSSPFDSIRTFFKRRSALSTLIIINVVVFIAVNLVNLFLWLFTITVEMEGITGATRITRWLAVPSHLDALLQKPWTLFTYMFTQENFMHILLNMVMLYFGGRIFLEYLDEKRLVNTYVWGGLVGALFYIAAFNIFPVFRDSVVLSVALGSSASVLAILIAIATFVPDYSVNLLLLGRIKLRYIAILFVVLDILSINRGNPGGHIAHLGGAFWGYLSIILLKKGHPNPLLINWYGIRNMTRWFRRGPRVTYYHKKTGSGRQEAGGGRPVTDEEYNRMRAEKQKRIDIILEKISRSGYDSLSREEKELLFKASNKDQ